MPRCWQERHGMELRDYQRRLLQAQPRPKFSRELLDLRRIQVSRVDGAFRAVTRANGQTCIHSVRFVVCFFCPSESLP